MNNISDTKFPILQLSIQDKGGQNKYKRTSNNVLIREFEKYDFDQVLAVIKGWLFHDNKSHHYLDKIFLGLDEKKTKGFRSMGILHYLGLKKEFKGIFKGKKISDAIEEMKNDSQDFSKILYYLCKEGPEIQVNLPELQSSGRDREFKKASFDEILNILFGWLFTTDQDHRYLDKFFLGLDEKKTKGFRSMGILHYLGLKKEFKGIFKGKKISDAIEEMKNDSQDFSKILYYLCLKIFSKEADIFDNISISDSFVFPSQKIGSGSGEKKLYIGHDNIELRNFFGNKGFKIKCFITKSNLISFLSQLENEYNCSSALSLKYHERMEKLKKLPEDLLFFELFEKTNIKGPRIYVNSEHEYYNIIREISLPNHCSLDFLKFINKNQIIFEIRLKYNCDDNYKKSFIGKENIYKVKTKTSDYDLINQEIFEFDDEEEILDLDDDDDF
jgi:hypothetical protein